MALQPEIKEMPLEGSAQREIMNQAQNMLLAFNGVLEELAFSRADEVKLINMNAFLINFP